MIILLCYLALPIIFFVFVFLVVVALFLRAIGVKVEFKLSINLNSVANLIITPVNIVHRIFDRSKELVEKIGISNKILVNILAILVTIIII